MTSPDREKYLFPVYFEFPNSSRLSTGNFFISTITVVKLCVFHIAGLVNCTVVQSFQTMIWSHIYSISHTTPTFFVKRLLIYKRF